MIRSQILKKSDMIACTLCAEAPCTGACKAMDPGDLLRHIWFDNEDVAALRLPEQNPCLTCLLFNLCCGGGCGTRIWCC